MAKLIHKPKMNAAESVYVPEIAKGLRVTIGRFLKNTFSARGSEVPVRLTMRVLSTRRSQPDAGAPSFGGASSSASSAWGSSTSAWSCGG